MRITANKAPRFSPLKNVLAVQSAVTLGVSLAIAVFDRPAAYSAVLGGLVNLVATTYASWRIFGFDNQGSPDRELANVYRAEVGKVVVIGGLCAVTFAMVEPINIIAFIGVFSITLVAGLIATAVYAESVPTKTDN